MAETELLPCPDEVFNAAWSAIQHSERIEIKTVRRKLSIHELRTFLQLVLAPHVQSDLTDGPPSKPSAAFDRWFDALPDNGESPYILAWMAYQHALQTVAPETATQRPEPASDAALVGKAREILADYDAGRPLQVSGDGWLVRFAAALSKAGG